MSTCLDDSSCYWDGETSRCYIYDDTKQLCVDLDGGENINVQGRTWGFPSYYPDERNMRIRSGGLDYCYSTKGLIELLCEGYNYGSKYIECPIACRDGACSNELPYCNDGTPFGECSLNQPLYCYYGNLVDHCGVCGCSEGLICQDNGACSDVPRCIQNGVCELENREDQFNCPKDCLDESMLPFRADFYCFSYENKNKPECISYYKDPCNYDGSNCYKVLACPKFYNPVCGTDGLFYPSACWAEQLGSKVDFYGICPSMREFMKGFWLAQGITMSFPDLEFSNGGTFGWKEGVWIRSSYWETTQKFKMLDFNIWAYYAHNPNAPSVMDIELTVHRTFYPAVGSSPMALLVFVMFDDAYPEDILIEWTHKYNILMNDYITMKEEVTNPIQYNIIPVVINPPEGVERPSTNHVYFSDEEIQKIYDSATSKIEQSDFGTLIVSPVFLNGFGGYYSWWNGMEFIEAPLTPFEPYSDIDKKAGLNSLIHFQSMFLTISHEVLHGVGLPGDHEPMGYGTYYLDSVGQDVDHITGKEIENPISPCDFYGISPDYYAVELPNNLKIRVGEEPEWLYDKIESDSGSCLLGLDNNDMLKDFDKDGEYEVMYKNNLIGIELQRFLGWVDIDGDGITEIVDPHPYGVCGNGIREGNEQCDDGNTVIESCVYGQTSCTVCGSSCQFVVGVTSYCGDGIIQTSAGEQCDDKNLNNYDGCSSYCKLETTSGGTSSGTETATSTRPTLKRV